MNKPAHVSVHERVLFYVAGLLSMLKKPAPCSLVHLLRGTARFIPSLLQKPQKVLQRHDQYQRGR